MSIITLTTDFGLKDHFVGSLKGNILNDYNEAQIVDISHLVDPFNTAEASYIVKAAYANFPKGSVHLIGVTAEKTELNQHLAALWNDHYFICADNGILSLLFQNTKPEKLVSISIHDRFPEDCTDIQILSKVAIHIAKGGSLSVIGKEITEIKDVFQLKPTVSPDLKSITGCVIYSDHFGNVVTNISKKMFLENYKNRNYLVRFKNKEIKTIFNKYSDFETNNQKKNQDLVGTKIAIFNEVGYLEIAVYKSNPNRSGSATSLFGLEYRDAVVIEFKD